MPIEQEIAASADPIRISRDRTRFIAMPTDQPGILALFAARPELAGPLGALAEALLRGPSSLTPGQRETIAAAVSRGNECNFCAATHGAAAAELGGAEDSDLMTALLAIAAAVRVSGQAVTSELVAAARSAGADDVAIHDTVLIAAAFSMFNRYVDGLATPLGPASLLHELGVGLAENGYLTSR